MTVTETEIHKGLAGVVRRHHGHLQRQPETNSLTYRGYPVQDLAARAASKRSPT